MPRLEARRSERIDYQAPVELLAHAGSDAAPCRVLARALDLGAGGMQLLAPVQMEIGASVTCRVTLDGESASLPGRVAWLRERGATRHDQGHGMGICFDPLGSHESTLLKNAVERSTAGYRMVQLHFAGLDEPVVAHGQARAGGLRLSAALPILARGTELSFRLDEEGPLFTGKIGDAVLKENRGARCLEVEVDVIEGESLRYRRNARYGYATEIEAEERGAAQTTAPFTPNREPEQQAATPDETNDASWPPWLSMLAAATLGACVTWAVIQSQDRAPQTDFVVHPRSAEQRHALAGDDEPETTTASVATLPRGAAEPRSSAPATPMRSSAARSPAVVDHNRSPAASSATSAKNQEPATGIESAPPLNEPSPSREPAGETQAEATAPRPATAPAAPLDAQPAATDASAPGVVEPEVAQPQIVVEAGATVVRVPFEGTLEQARSRIWAVPHALAVDLPFGRTPLALGRYPLNQGGVTDLQLNGRGDQLLVRVKTSVPIAAYELAIADGMLEARLVHAPAPRVSEPQP
jgi:hypothetical protein